MFKLPPRYRNEFCGSDDGWSILELEAYQVKF